VPSVRSKRGDLGTAIALQHTPSTFEQNLRFPDALEVSTEFDKIMIEIIYFEYLRRLSE
jgi:hypothetical protein